MRSLLALGLGIAALAACHQTDPAGQGGSAGGEPLGSLPVRNPADPERAARGEAHFSDGTFARGLFPGFALRSLYYVWGGGPPGGGGDAAYWAAFRERYGMFEAPYPNDGLPMGIRKVGDAVTFDCRLCHASVVAGQTAIGAANTRLDFQGLMDDLQTLADLAVLVGFPAYVNPLAGQGRTGAAGVHDAMGLGFSLSKLYGPAPAGLATDLGFSRSPAWWSMKYKGRIYTDGSGDVEGQRTMMAMFLAFGMPLSELVALDEPIEDVRHHALSLTAPSWPFAAPDAGMVAEGRGVFDATCASCHGVHTGPKAGYPDIIVPRAEVGTDPIRAERLTPVEADWVNSTWFGADHPMKASGGYLAPPLVGVWAAAPYFHDGSVPDLRSVVRSAERPVAWRRTGSMAADYAEARVGGRFEAAAPVPGDTIEHRRVVDTTRPGLSASGHTYGDALSEAEVASLLAYLKTL